MISPVSTSRSSSDSFSSSDRRAFQSVAVQFFVNGALFASFVPRLPEIRDRVDVSVSTIGILLSLAGVSGLIGSALVSGAIGRFGTRGVMLWGSACVSASLAVVGLAQSPIVLVIGLVGMMTFDVLVDVAMNMQGSWLSSRRRTPVLNRLHGLWSLGTLVGGAVSSRMAAAGVSLTSHVVGAAIVLLLVLAYVGPGLLRSDQEGHADVVDDAPKVGGRTLSKVVLLGFFAAGGFGVTLELTSIDWAAFRLSDDFGLSAGSAALGYVAVTAGMTLARFAGDSVVARIGNAATTWLSLAFTAVGVLIGNLSTNSDMSTAGYLLVGAGIAPLLPAMYDTAARYPGRAGVGLGALTAGMRSAALAMPAFVGFLAGTSLTVGQAIAIVALPSVAGFALSVARLDSTR